MDIPESKVPEGLQSATGAKNSDEKSMNPLEGFSSQSARPRRQEKVPKEEDPIEKEPDFIPVNEIPNPV